MRRTLIYFRHHTTRTIHPNQKGQSFLTWFDVLFYPLWQWGKPWVSYFRVTYFLTPHSSAPSVQLYPILERREQQFTPHLLNHPFKRFIGLRSFCFKKVCSKHLFGPKIKSSYDIQRTTNRNCWGCCSPWVVGHPLLIIKNAYFYISVVSKLKSWKGRFQLRVLPFSMKLFLPVYTQYPMNLHGK